MSVNNRGFSLVELMISLTILAIGLLALAQLQVVAIQGSAASRKFSTAINLAKITLEEVKPPGVFLYYSGSFVSNGTDTFDFTMSNHNTDNDSDSDFDPDITSSTAIGSLKYDTIETFDENRTTFTYDTLCRQAYPNTCSTAGVDYVRIVNIRNIPSGEDSNSMVMKEVNVIVLWKEGEWTRSVNAMTLVGRKDYDFF